MNTHDHARRWLWQLQCKFLTCLSLQGGTSIRVGPLCNWVEQDWPVWRVGKEVFNKSISAGGVSLPLYLELGPGVMASSASSTSGGTSWSTRLSGPSTSHWAVILHELETKMVLRRDAPCSKAYRVPSMSSSRHNWKSDVHAILCCRPWWLFLDT